ncbi:MAG: PKD domain-containing protein [Candidatus Bathyarchaeota archaeon]|nr:PKD domain-containing protein [Candidatus Bathyarchaeota archaeon]
MRGRVVSVLVLMLLAMAPMAWCTTVSDSVDDGIDYFVYYNEHQTIPAPLIMDMIAVTATSGGDQMVYFVFEFNEPIPTDAPYNLQIALDTDQDPMTGINSPEWYYNQLGVDHMIEIEFNGVDTVGAVSGYSEGIWTEIASPVVAAGTDYITVSVDHAAFGDSTTYSIMTYIITGIGLDMAPEEGETPLEYDTGSIPEIIDTEPELVYIFSIDYPETVEEGTSFQLDVVDFPEDPSLVPYTYEWDLDGDGIYDVIQDAAPYTHTYPQNGEYSVSLRVTDASGIKGETTQTISVLNTPPYEPQITTQATVDQGETLTITGTASDLGEDSLTYTWIIDGETHVGETISVSFDSPGEKTITLTVTDEDGGTVQTGETVNVNELEPEQEPEPEIDPLLIILVVLFGVGGIFIYNSIKPKAEEEKKPEEKPKEKKGFCEEHPEVVEQEEKACWDAQFELDNAIGNIQDRLDVQRDIWRKDIREASRTIMEWDINYAMIQSLTKSEEEIKKSSETVQRVASIVKPGASMGKTAFKKGGEEAMKELGKHVATEVGKSVAGDLSSTVNDVLSLESWAYTEIGTGIAKLLTGIDPKKEASKLRKESTRIANDLQSWVDKDMAKTRRYTPRTLHTCIDEAQQMMDDIGTAIDNFEQAISGFRCVDCDMPDHILDEIDALIKELDGFIKTFGDLIDQIEQRLNQAVALYKRKDVYDSPMTWLHAQNNEVINIQESLGKSAEAKKG